MQVSTVALAVIAEIFVILMVACGLLALQVRRSRSLTKRLQDRMKELVANIQEDRARKKAAAVTPGGGSYIEFLNTQLKLTHQRHQALEPGGNIALDLDSATPLPRRIAALRYAMLVAERDVADADVADDMIWSKLESRYQQLLQYYAPGDAQHNSHDPAELEVIQEELQSYKKRVVNLERFKALYFELEKRWKSCSATAQTQYDELRQIASQMDEPEALEDALIKYQASYAEVGTLLEEDIDSFASNSASARAAQQATGEIRHLRNITVDQHRIIHDLQRKLAAATTQSEATSIIDELKEALEKQLRFARESEICVQLLEDELANVHRESEHMRNQLQEFSQAKAERKSLQDTNDEQEKTIFVLRGENQSLTSKLRALQDKSGAASGGDPDLKKELSQLKRKYAELEESYLDLKGTSI